jgi:hypothetical protein
VSELDALLDGAEGSAVEWCEVTGLAEEMVDSFGVTRTSGIVP